MENLDVHPRIHNALKKAHLKDYGSVLSMSTVELERVTQLSASDVHKLQDAVALAVPRLPMVTGHQLLQKDCPKQLQTRYLTTGCQVLDRFLHGGLINPGLIEIAGESASGKTQLCLQLCLTTQLPETMGGLRAGALYICTEDVFPNRRLMQMVELLRRRAGTDIGMLNFTDNIYIEHASEVDDLMHCVKVKLPLLIRQGRVKLVIIDSVAALFRCSFEVNETMKRAKVLSSLAATLHQLSSRNSLCVVCVNQVSDVFGTSSDSRGHRHIPALGLAWANLVTVRLLLTRTERSVSVPTEDAKGAVTNHVDSVVRSMEVLFAPHLPNTLCHYIIDQEGVKGLS